MQQTYGKKIYGSHKFHCLLNATDKISFDLRGKKMYFLVRGGGLLLRCAQPRKLAQAIMLLTCIQVVSDSNLAWGTDYSGFLCSFPQSLQVNTIIIIIIRAIAFHGRFCQIASTFDFSGFRNIVFLQSKVQLPTWTTRPLYLCTLVTEWPSYSHREPRSLFVTFYDSQGDNGGTLTHLLTGRGRIPLYLTRWRLALLEMPPVVQLLKIFPTFYGT
jgi:hypothetical protein